MPELAVVTASMKPSYGSCALSAIFGRVWTRLFWSFVLGTLLGASSAHALPYTVDMSSPYVNHWEQWAYHYDDGWSATSIRGNGSDVDGYVRVVAKDGTFGQTVDVRLTFTVSYDWYFVDIRGYDATHLENFAGLSSGGIESTMTTSSNGFIGSGPSHTITRTDTQSGFDFFTINTPFVVGNPAGMFFTLHLDHPIFLPEGLAVFDEARPATFGVQTNMSVRLTKAEVIGVPDSGLTIALLGGTLTGLFFLKRRSRNRWSFSTPVRR